jgi:hypothetical protein
MENSVARRKSGETEPAGEISANHLKKRYNDWKAALAWDSCKGTMNREKQGKRLLFRGKKGETATERAQSQPNT